MNQYIYISAERSNLTKEQNQLRTNLLQSQLIELGYNFEVVIGCYREEIASEPSEEVSFKVKTYHEQDLIRLAKAFNQDAILIQEGRMGSLVDLINNKVTFLGYQKYHKQAPVGCYTKLSNGKFITFEE